MFQVILIFGIYGACRRSELLNLTIDDIEDKDSIIIVKIQDSKTHTQRTFIISNLTYIKLYRKYYTLRPEFTTNRRFFIRYVNGKCVKQVIGINKIRNTPKEIATYLKLSEAESYTGHCFRRSSATLLADSGADFASLKRHGGWRSSTVAEGYIEESIEKKIVISNSILSARKSGASSITTQYLNQETIAVSDLPSSSGVSFHNCTITTLNLNDKRND